MYNHKNPKITVLMPVYNCELYIRESIESILNQTFDDFEFLIIDDASTDSTVDKIKMYNDKRIKLIEKSLNTGLTNSLNYGLAIAKGEYIARMDGDDISLPKRFEKQIAFLDQNQDVILCGTLYKIIGTEKVCEHPLFHDEIKVKLISGCYIAHPTVMIRKFILEQNKISYDSTKEPAEDYDLWSRLAFLGKLSNIGEVLLHYRVHPLQVSILRREKQIKISDQIKIRMLQKVMPSLKIDFDKFVLIESQKWVKVLIQKLILYDRLMIENSYINTYDSKYFLDFINQEKISIWKQFSQKKESYSLLNLLRIITTYPRIFLYLGLKDSTKYIIKCFF
ncbi:glycosyltransferase family 2 protein [Flavobacterium sp. RS13.1]|uniref:glycosyltransferase family 2 protein n=1 Tax=Flavobacterium sp. RS13.1 TaxID=3400345 RepID=UPI003AAF27E3